MTETFPDDLPLWSAPFGLALLDTIGMRKNMNVLDIGSGNGFPMLELSERLGETCTVYGLDPMDEFVAVISEKIAARKILNARILKGVAEKLPFPDGFFGLIVSNNGLNNVQDQAASLSECCRVASWDAQMVLTMNLPHTMIEFYEVFEETMNSLGMSDRISRIRDHISEKRRSVEYWEDLIIRSGFAIRSVHIDGFKMKFSGGTAFLGHSFIRNAFSGAWNDLVPVEKRTLVFDTIRQKLDAVATEKGELSISVPFVCFDCLKNK